MTTTTTTDKNLTMAILGISDNEERYAYKAYKKLLDYGYKNLVGITPKPLPLEHVTLVDSIKAIKDLPAGKNKIHTLTVYVGAARLEDMIDDILALAPQRLLLNPGTENQNLMAKAKAVGIEVIEGCTLVMLNTNQF